VEFDGRGLGGQIWWNLYQGEAIAELDCCSGLSILDVFVRCAEKTPGKAFVRLEHDTLTYGAALARARALAAALYDLGIEAGDRIAIDLPNGPEFVVTALAAANLGAAIVPLNPAYSPHELQFMLRNSEASALVAVEKYEGLDKLELFERMQFSLPDLQYVVTVGEEDLWYDDRIFQFEDLLLSGERKVCPTPKVNPEQDVYAILYTAGTTGKPKGVTLTHANLVRTNAAVAGALQLGGEDAVFILAPLFNIFGLGALVAALSAGSAVVLMGRFDAAESLRLAARTKATFMVGAPAQFAMQIRAESLEEVDLSRLRAGIVTGAPVSDALARSIRERLIPGLEIAYGLTETSSTVSVTRPDDPPAARHFTAGRLLDGVEAVLLDEHGEPLPVESVGELAVRGFNVMKGYNRQPEETSRAFTAAGYFRTGDLAMLDEEGFLHIIGQQRDTIVRGEHRIQPREIEDLLRLHPAVDEVAVVGVDDDVLGQLSCACIRLVEGAIVTGDEIKEFCRGQVAQYKVPDLIRFVDAFPMAGSGKIRRIELTRMVRSERAMRRD
jgi:fatty-acyl-CoA synthase